MRIEDYGFIGDMQLLLRPGRNGAVDWLCLPRFDSPSCFWPCWAMRAWGLLRADG